MIGVSSTVESTVKEETNPLLKKMAERFGHEVAEIDQLVV